MQRMAESWFHYVPSAGASGGQNIKSASISTQSKIQSNGVRPMSLLETALSDIERGEHEKAFASLRSILNEQPNNVPAYFALGDLLYRIGQYISSAGCYHKILEIDPNSGVARIRLGIACEAAGDVKQAIQHFQQARNIEPYLAHHNLSRVYQDAGDPKTALRNADAAIRLRWDAELQCRRAHALLTLGRYKLGFEAYEARHGVPLAVTQGSQWVTSEKNLESLYRLPQDLRHWRGQPVLHLVVHHEQGFGDTIQWARYVPLAAARCDRLSFVVPESLVGLMGHSFLEYGNITVRSNLPADFDSFVWVDSLPYLFNARPGAIPQEPYLFPAQTVIELETTAGKPRIGLVWAGRPGLRTDRWRSIAFAEIASLLDCDAQFISLQKEGLSEDDRLLHVPNHLKSWETTAQLIQHLDLVISVDTAVAHLAGALGKDVWLMNRFNTCWRWGLTRSDSIWYPSMRIFRQPTLGDWASVIKQVKQALSKAF
jgi:tetratricopeptide (TPR) repeat protein